MRNICLAYISCNQSYSRDFEKQLKSIDFKKLTHIAIAFSTIKEENGAWIPFLSSDVINGIKKIQAEIAVQNAATRLILSIGGANCDGFCQASSTHNARKHFTEKAVKLINELNLDGIDIDWEFPGESALGIASCKHCKKDFILLLKELRKQLNSNQLLTIAAGSNRYFGLNVKQIENIIDYVFVMTYDLGYMHSNIYLSKMFINMWHLFGISKNKLCIGVPLYGRNLKHLEEDLRFNELSKGKITNFLGQSFSYYNGSKWCFDTEKDVKKKALWAQKKGLGGIFCWEIKGDDNNRILNAMNEKTS
ncbi:MAG: hypothetical protein K2I14_04895 [Eubacterium sp.]|nr:hypothetical protein [Eubacterium sp.]